jgi:hypothetical protein
MASKAVRAYSAIIFTFYCILLCVCSIYTFALPALVLSTFASLPISLQETNVLVFFCQITYNSQLLNFFIQGALLGSCTVLAPNRKRFVGYVAAFQFFLNFFCIFFLVHAAPVLFASITTDFLVNILGTSVCLLVFGLLPALLVDRVLRHAAASRAARVHSELKIKTCKHCGEKYRSNPVICAKCNQRMD